MNPPSVLIVVLNWNGLQDTLECLASLRELHYANHRVLVVDNGSSDGSPEIIAEKFPEVVLLRNVSNEGFAGGNNRAIDFALNQGFDYCWFFNNDAAADPGALSALMRCAETDERIGLLSPVLYHADRPDTVQACGGVIDWENWEFALTESVEDWNDANAYGRAYLWGTALLVRREVLQTIGGFEEKFFAYVEDRHFCMRAKTSGFDLALVPEAKIYHKWSQSSGGDHAAPFKVFLMRRNNYFFWRQHLEGANWHAFQRKYFLDGLTTFVRFHEDGRAAAARACERAMWCAVRDIGGSPEVAPDPPGLVDRLFFSHPFFWRRVLRKGVRERPNPQGGA